MAVLFGRISSISRGLNNSAITAAAYRSCSKLTLNVTDKETGVISNFTHNYTGKKGLVFSQIFAPTIKNDEGIVLENPDWVYDRQLLWQRIEEIETRADSELAKEYIVALPREFTVEQNIELLQEFIVTSFTSRGIVADVNYHADNPNNPHAHIMFPMRSLEINEQGEIDFGGKQRTWKSFTFLNTIKREQQTLINAHYAKMGFAHRLEWGVASGFESTLHHGGIKNLWIRNQEIIRRNSSRIIADPTLVIDKLNHNKAVFTREDIERELYLALENNIYQFTVQNALEENDNINSVDQAQNEESKEAKEDREYRESIKTAKDKTDGFIQTEVLKMLDVVLLSSKLTIVNSGDLRGKMLFAKTDQVELEQRFIGNVQELQQRNNHCIDVKEEDIAKLEEDREFTEQQKEVISKTLAGSDISIIEGWPGAGKSTVSKEIVRHYVENDYEIIAAAPTNKAAQELAAKLGVQAYTTSTLRMNWQYDRGYEAEGINLPVDYYKQEQYRGEIVIYDENVKTNDNNTNNAGINQDIKQDNSRAVITSKTVLIMDEISMIDTPTFDYFVSEIKKHGGKIICIGDNNQNQAIGMKGAAAKAIEIAGSNILTEVNRHINTDKKIRKKHKAATAALSSYDVAEAIEIYSNLGSIKISDSEDQKEQAIAKHYITKLQAIAKDGGREIVEAFSKIAISAYTNDEIKRLNILVRDLLKESEILTKEGVKFLAGGLSGNSNIVELCIGDQIIFRNNQRKKGDFGGVMNNEMATVREIISTPESGEGVFAADVRRGDSVHRVLIKTGEEGRPISFRHAYAITSYAMQGMSINHMLLSIDRYSGYEVTLVGLTRHKIDCVMFAAKKTLEDEVYLTKDFNVARAREEFEAKYYKYEQDKETNKSIKVDLPLWRLGLNLLVNKRSNLNLAIDYRYNYGNANKAGNNNIDVANDDKIITNTNIDNNDYAGHTASYKELHQHRMAICAGIEYMRTDLNQQLDIINKYEYEANNSIEISKAELAKMNLSDLDMIVNNRFSKFDLFVAQHFTVKGKDVTFDVRDVIAAPTRYELNSLDEQQEKPMSWADHVKALKAGAIEGGVATKLNWLDLSKLDQDIVLHSYLDSEDRKFLEKHVNEIVKLEEEITLKLSENKSILNKIEEEAKLAHIQLTGNFALARDYLEARVLVMKAYRDFNRNRIEEDELNEIVAVRTECAVAIVANYNNHLISKDTIDITDADSAVVLQVKDHLKISSDNEKSIIIDDSMDWSMSNADLHENDNTDNPGNDGADLNINNVIAATITIDINNQVNHLVKQSNYSNNLIDVSSAVIVQARAENIVRVRSKSFGFKFIKHSDGNIDDANIVIHQKDAKSKKSGEYPSIAKILSQLGCSYHTIAKHAGVADGKNYFEEIGKNSINSIIKNEHYKIIMQMVEKAGKDDLAKTDIYELREAYTNLLLEQKKFIQQIDDIQLKLAELQEEYSENEDQLKEYALYKHEKFNSYIGSIYKTNRLEVIAKLDEMLGQSSDSKQLMLALIKSPEMLGELKVKVKQPLLYSKIGILARIFGLGSDTQLEYTGNDRDNSNINLAVFEEKLKLYVKNNDNIIKITESQKKNEYEKQKQIANEKIPALKLQLANTNERELLNYIEQIEKKSIGKDGEINDKLISININRLFRENETLDIFYDWQVKLGMIEPIKRSDKDKLGKQEHKSLTQHTENNDHTKHTSHKPRVWKKSISFEDVLNALDASHYENLFHMYVHRINPDDKIVKKGNQMTCGSLNMALSNGLWNRFSRGKGGNIFGFVSEAMSCDIFEACNILASYVGLESTKEYVNTGSDYNGNSNNRQSAEIKNIKLEPKDEWIAISKMPQELPNFEQEKYLRWKLEEADITAIYSYYDDNNKKIGYTVRIVNRETGNKEVIPVSYCYNEARNQYGWYYKGFSDSGKKPIYGLEKLTAENAVNDNAEAEQKKSVSVKPILIVEGEKTTDIAQKLLPEYMVISWMGGAMATHLVNWKHLCGREIVIWPDNDEPGQNAAAQIKSHIDQANGYVGLVHIIDTDKLPIPKKWDLGDELPKELSVSKVRDLITDAVNTPLSEILQPEKEQVKTMTKAAEQSGWQEAIKVLDMLEPKRRINLDHIKCKQMYKQTLAIIATQQNKEIIEGGNLVDTVRGVQYEYENMERNFISEDYQNKRDNGYTAKDLQEETTDKRKKIKNDIIKEAVLLHQVQLGTTILLPIHIKHIKNTAESVLHSISDKQLYEGVEAGERLYKAISSDEWWRQLQQQNQEKAINAKDKLKAKDIDEYSKLLLAGTKAEDLRKTEQTMGKIQEIVNYLSEKGIKDEKQLLYIYKVNMTAEKIHAALVKKCCAHEVAIIKNNLNHIKQNKSLHIDNKEFTKPQEYLKHVLDSYDKSSNSDKSNKKYLPVMRINKMLEALNEQKLKRKQKEHRRQDRDYDR